MREKLDLIDSYIDEHEEEMIGMWRDFVNTESGTRDKECVDAMSDKLERVFSNLGFTCELHDVGPENGKALVGTWGGERPGKPVILSGHYDTVFAKGTFGNDPFTIDDNGIVHGPGCLDMKGGIVMAAFIIRALQSIDYNERPVQIIFLGDEEKGHQQANTPTLIMEWARGGLCAFNMETGRMNNHICVGRKGGSACLFTVNGVAAHSGTDFLKGRNAIAEMAHKILDIQSLTDLNAGTTLSVTIIRGGSVQNSIPDRCSIEVDVRYETFEERDRVKNALEDIAAKTYVEGTHTTVEFFEHMAPFMTTPGVEKLAGFVEDISRKYGFGEMGRIRLGGGSDASYIAMAGTPCVCSMGVCGEFMHTDKEYAVADTLFKRTKLMSAVILNLREFEQK